jgi:reactive intermediate/imine deaminase
LGGGGLFSRKRNEPDEALDGKYRSSASLHKNEKVRERCQMPSRKILKPATVAVPDEFYSPGLRYKNWVFVSGVMATDYKTGLPSTIRSNDAIPLAGESVLIRESEYIFKTLDAVLAEGNTSLPNGVRIDQFPSTRDMVDPYHVVRRGAIDPPRPASTSVHIAGLSAPDAHTMVELVAIVPGPGFQKEGINSDKVPQPLGGYSPAIRAGDFVFLAGQVPTDWKSGVAPEARVDPNFWEGNKIDRETRLTLKNMGIILEAAGSSMRNVVKAQVYLTDINDLPRLDRVWREFFPDDPPARTVYPINTLGVTDSRVEINFVAVTDTGKTKKAVIATDTARKPIFHESQAVRAGELLFLSGLLAADANGVVSAARHNPHYPYGRDRAAAQSADIMEQAQAICRAAGTDLKNAVRLLTVHTDLNESYSAAQIQRKYFSAGAPASSTICVPGPLQVPGCTVMADIWVGMEA